jgi:hypothetical protein
MKIYDYLFYKINQLVSLFDYDTSFASIIILCWLFLFNSLTLFYFLSFLIDIKAILNIYASITGGIVIIGGHLLYFLWKGRIEKINNTFKDENKTTAIFSFIGAILYIGLTNWFFWFVAAPNMGGILK